MAWNYGLSEYYSIAAVGYQNLTIHNNHFGAVPGANCSGWVDAIMLKGLGAGSNASVRFNYFESIYGQDGTALYLTPAWPSEASMTVDARLNAWAPRGTPVGWGLVESLIFRYQYTDPTWRVEYSPWIATGFTGKWGAASAPGFAPSPGYPTAAATGAAQNCCVGFPASALPAGFRCAAAFPAGCSQQPGAEGSSLQRAAWSAPAGSTIWLSAGLYSMPYLEVYKTLTLVRARARVRCTAALLCQARYAG